MEVNNRQICSFYRGEHSLKCHSQLLLDMIRLAGKQLTGWVDGVLSWQNVECWRKFQNNTRVLGLMPGVRFLEK